jgi:hypothetical protein
LFAPALRDDDLTEKQRKESGLGNPSTNFGCIAFRVTTSYRMLTTFGVAIASMTAMRDDPRAYDGTIMLTRRE